MGQALYRKYRSKTLDEIIGQEHITRTLSRALQAGHISHAYLFTGPRGVGKTSIARILAHEVNGLPYTDDSSHLDIIEIDAASNRRIDEIRDLRDRVNIAPTSAKYKVYIIDEVHMLTREAFNALLKTLEEPPAHVIFMLATTEAYKLPETIISRTQRYAFRPVPIDKVVAHLHEIASAEKITVDDAALELIARHGEGSFRDSISLLDQARTIAPKLGIGEIRNMLGLASDEGITTLIEQTESGESNALVQSLQQLREQGFEAVQLAKQLSQTWRRRLLASETQLSAPALLALLERLLNVASAGDPSTLLEIVLLQTAMTITPKQAVAAQHTPDTAISSAEVSSPSTDKPKPVAKPPSTATSPFTQTIWPEILNVIKKDHNTLYGIIRMATPEFSEGQLDLVFRFAFHQKRVNDARNKKIIAGAVAELTGQTVKVICELNTEADAPQITEQVTPEIISSDAKTDPSLITISNIFGGGELLESEN